MEKANRNRIGGGGGGDGKWREGQEEGQGQQGRPPTKILLSCARATYGSREEPLLPTTALLLYYFRSCHGRSGYRVEEQEGTPKKGSRWTRTTISSLAYMLDLERWENTPSR